MAESLKNIEQTEWVGEAIKLSAEATRMMSVDEDGHELDSRGAIVFNKEFALKFAHNYSRRNCPCDEDYAGPDAGDCTHYLSHVLRAGGLAITGASGRSCGWGCITWAPDALAAFERACASFDNVRRLRPADAGRGDFGFLRHGEVPWHAFVLAGPLVSGNSAPVWSHSNYRDGEVVQAEFGGGAYYRIG